MEYSANLSTFKMIKLIKDEMHLIDDLTEGEDSKYSYRTITHAPKKAKLLKMRILSSAARKAHKKEMNSFIQRMRRKLLNKKKIAYKKKNLWNPIRGEWE